MIRRHQNLQANINDGAKTCWPTHAWTEMQAMRHRLSRTIIHECKAHSNNLTSIVDWWIGLVQQVQRESHMGQAVQC